MRRLKGNKAHELIVLLLTKLFTGRFFCQMKEKVNRAHKTSHPKRVTKVDTAQTKVEPLIKEQKVKELEIDDVDINDLFS